MKAYTYIEKGKFKLIDKPKPTLLEPTDAIVKVTLGSICTSDLHIKHGSVPRAVVGVTIGHEMVGIVEEVGSAVTKVKKGDKAVISVDALPGEEFTGELVRLYPVMDAATHTFNVEIQVRNSSARLRPGMYARVNLNLGDNRSIVIPDQAVIKQQGSGQKYVFVIKDDNTVESRIVTLGRYFDNQYEILSGLNEGERVVVKGHSALRSGDKVEVAQ